MATDNNENWFVYDWKYEGNDAIIGVDTSYYEGELGDKLVIIVCSSKNGELKDGEAVRFLKLKEKIMKKSGCKYAGYIETNSEVRFYFYGYDKENIDNVCAMCEKEKRVRVEARTDSNKSTYNELLYPDTAKQQTETNRETIEEYEDYGDTITSPRKLNLHMHFSSEPLRVLFQEEARLSGFAIGDNDFLPDISEDYPHSIIVHKISTLLKRDVDEITTGIIRIAEKYDGILLYWDCNLIPRRK